MPKRPASSLDCADWLTFARTLAPASIDLLYVDPPFNTGKAKRGLRGERATYHDSWPTLDAYIAWLHDRLLATLPALKPSANVLIHCDWRASHRIRVLLDELLGVDRFKNHLIWTYGLGGSSPKQFARKHDDILFYCIDPRRAYFQPPMVPATSNRMKGKSKKATDVIAIPSLNNMSSERTGYPTQKPVLLLELLIEACCPPGGTVLDPCCGSGTTGVAAMRLERTFFGCDASARAVAITNQRLARG